MVEFTKGYKIPKDGKYLVRTVTTFLKNEHYVHAYCTLSDYGTSVNVSNQNVTHISKLPL